MIRYRVLKTIAAGLVLGLAAAYGQSDQYGSWMSTTAPISVDTALVLTDGSIVAQAYAKPTWYRLIPDKTGNYATGTWVALPPMPAINNTYPYAPYDYCSAILPDGRLIVTGGEYTYDTTGTATASETNQGTIWDWKTNTWTIIPPPYNAGSTTTQWSRIGDSSCVVNANGQFMINQQNHNGNVAIFNPATNTYGPTMTPTGKQSDNSESGWTLLPDGSIFVTDVNSQANSISERYLPPYLANNTNGLWVPGAAATTIGRMSYDNEIGPQVLRYDGSVVVFGIQNGAASGKNGVYTPPATLSGTGSWTALSPFPVISSDAVGACDAVGTLLPNGNVMVSTSSGPCYSRDGHLFVVTPDNQLTEAIGPPTIYGTHPAASSTTGISSFWARMLVLPNGQMLFSYDNKTIWFYTPTGGPDPSWAPTITDYSQRMTPGNTYTLTGTQFNGYSVGSTYGDDGEMASNYPIVRFTNHLTGDVQYGRTHDHSTMAVRTLSLPVTTQLDPPPSLEPGAADLQVIANGIISSPVVVNTIDITLGAYHTGNFVSGQTGATLGIHVSNNGVADSSGLVTVSDALPAGLTATGISGSAWSCTLANLTCSRSDSLAAGSSFPDITVTVTVAGNAQASLVNTATVAGGADNTPNNNTATDPITVGSASIVTTAQLALVSGGYQATVTLTNQGTGPAQNVQLTSATLGSASGSPLPQSLPDIPAGSSIQTVVTFPSSAGSPNAGSVERYSGSYTGGSFSAGLRVILP